MVPKARIRSEALARRRLMSPQERSRRSEAVAEGLMSLDVLRPGATVCFYLATWEEVETRPLVARALEIGCRVVLPKVADGANLELYPVDDLSAQMGVGSFGIEEPIGGSNAPVPPESVDCFVVPGVAFDTSGRRCGFGLGYFDRLLARRAPGAVVVALAFECQLKPALPAEEHDVLMDVLCTEKRIFDCRGQSSVPQVEPQPADSREVKIP